MQQDKDIRLEKALDIIEAGTQISEEQLQELLSDDALLGDVALANELRAAVRAQGAVDVEARLEKFHQSASSAQQLVSMGRPNTVDSPSKKPSARLIRRLIPVLAIAAVFIGAIVMLLPRSSTPNTQHPTPNTTEVFTADATPAELTLTDQNGKTLALKTPADHQPAPISIDDYCKMLSQAETERMTLDVPYGKSADIILPDGSIAYLHPGSRLRFPTDFSGQQRIVILEGEAYFKVKHDSSRPFVVMADGMQTTVLGTEFHVSSQSHEVVLVTGSVRVSNEGQQVMLRPHQQCSFANGGCSTADVDVTPYEMWRDGYLYFDNVELRTILEAIGQNFNMTVEFRNTDALHYKMRFISERNKGPQAAIDMMNRMKKVCVRQEGNRLIVE